MGTVQLITCFRFSVQLFISEGIFLIGRPKKEHFGIRILLSFLAYILGTIHGFSLCPELVEMYWLSSCFSLLGCWE